MRGIRIINYHFSGTESNVLVARYSLLIASVPFLLKAIKISFNISVET